MSFDYFRASFELCRCASITDMLSYPVPLYPKSTLLGTERTVGGAVILSPLSPGKWVRGI